MLMAELTCNFFCWLLFILMVSYLVGSFFVHVYFDELVWNHHKILQID